MAPRKNPRREHDFLPWAVQSTQDNVVEIARGDGVFFWDPEGNKFLDFISQLFNLNLGHGNERLIRAIQEQAGRLCAASSSLIHEGRVSLGKRLAEITPGDLCKAFFTNSGSEANEIALTMARIYTGRRKVMAKYRSYHGTTLGTLTVCGDPRRMSVDFGPPGTVRFFDPYCYRCDFGLDPSRCGLHCAEALEQQVQMEGPDTIAAIIVEPFTAAAGGFPAPGGFLSRVREICDRYGIVMIADEVICGFGRTGEWFAVNHEGVVPDILTVAKGITSAYVPMGAAIVNRRIADFFEEQLLPIGCTYTGHPLACAAALAAIDEYRERNAIGNAKAMGALLENQLEIIKERRNCAGDIRCKGLFACIELVKEPGTKVPLIPFNTNDPLVGEIKREYLRRGLFMYNRWNLLLIAPPLVISENELRSGLELLDDLLKWIDERVGVGK